MAKADHYDYELPDDLIAQQPLACRSDARLMVVDRKAESITHSHIRDLGEFLRAGDALVLNDTKVIPAKLVGFRTKTGGRWQGLYLESDDQGIWRILGKTRGKLQVGESLTLEDRHAQPHTQLHLVAKLDDGHWAARPACGTAAEELLETIGRVPLPHYIRDGIMIDADLENYQTVFATTPGSVAAPTAGLHFTPALMDALMADGVQRHFVTLHVGLGTFRPISSADIGDHKMHREWSSISEATTQYLRAARANGGRVVAVGTTSIRTLESAASQGELASFTGHTELFIRPPFTFHATDGLLTNFHLPRSTLLVLVRTFGGDALIRRAYEIAVEDQYRFYSYGDAMLIL